MFSASRHSKSAPVAAKASKAWAWTRWRDACNAWRCRAASKRCRRRASKEAEKAANKVEKAAEKASKEAEKAAEKAIKFTKKVDNKIAKAFEKYAKDISKAQARYQKAAQKIVEAKNLDKKIQQAEDKLASRISNADNKFVEDLGKVSKQLVKNESVSLVSSGWISDKVYSKDFVNHGQRVKTYIEIAKAQGLPAYVGALQANFGNPIETGIVDLQNQISDLNNQLALSTQTLEANINNINLLEAELLTFDTQLINFNNR